MNTLTFASGVTIVYTALAMWATQPSYSCVLSEHLPHRLYMDRQVDREHLARDAQRIQQLARRHAHAKDVVNEAQIAELCRDELARHVASAHQVSTDDVRGLLRKASPR